MKGKDMTEESPALQFFTERSKRKTPKKGRKLATNNRVATGKSVMHLMGNVYARTRGGFREDIGISVRSGWESNVARIFKAFDIPYTYESVIFEFPIIKGNKTYTPDFILESDDGVFEYIEVKGLWNEDSRIKMKRFKKYYPEDFANLTMIISKYSKRSKDICAELKVPCVLYYEDLVRIFKPQIANWEGTK